MSVYLSFAALVVSAASSFFFSVLTYALRDFSRSKLADYLGLHDGDKWFETLTEQTEEYIFVTAVFRQLSNILTWVSAFLLIEGTGHPAGFSYAASILVGCTITLFCSVALPHAIAKYAAEAAIGFSAPVLSVLRTLVAPLTRLMDAIDDAVRRALGVQDEHEAEEIEQDILSAVEEGEKEGIVDEQERELIENVIDFRDTAAIHIMTARPQIVAIELGAGLDEVRALIESSGHSRIPVYEGALDKVVGILYARDLLKTLGQSRESFDMRSAVRPAMFIPETKPLRNLLTDFRQQKVHMAIVLDEYGGTAGLVTIEDILEELVGEISDEHEPQGPALFRRTGEVSAEADARLPVAELNREMGLSLPEDAGYETIGGFLTTSMGRIPAKSTVYETAGARFTVLEAEPQRVKRLRIELTRPAPHALTTSAAG